jgi:transcriptional regulator with XRE-family HTH domain
MSGLGAVCGARVRAARQSLRLSQQALAVKLGVAVGRGLITLEDGYVQE